MAVVSWGQLSQLSALPASCVSETTGWHKKQKRPLLCVSTAQQWPKHPCITNTVSRTNPKHGPILATVKKINYTPAKSSITGGCKARSAEISSIVRPCKSRGGMRNVLSPWASPADHHWERQASRETTALSQPNILLSTSSISCWRYRKFSKQCGWNSMLNWHCEHPHLGASCSSSLCFCPCKPSLHVPVEQISFSCGFHRKLGVENSLLGILNLKLPLLGQSILLSFCGKIHWRRPRKLCGFCNCFLSYNFEPFSLSPEAHKPGFQWCGIATSSASGHCLFRESF